MNNADSRYYATLKILGLPFTGLLDSGATISVISKKFCDKIVAMGFKLQPIPKENISTADGTNHTINSMVHVPVEFLEGYKVISFYIMEYLQHDLILGMNFFESFNLAINANYGDLSCITPITSDLITNSKDESSKGISTFRSRDDLAAHERASLDHVIEEMKSNIGAGLGKTSLISHRIDTGNHLPVSQRQYPFAPPIMREIEKEIQDMLDMGVIEPSYSSWRSPVLIVKKATGKNRLCLDSRQLNKITKKDSYPLPRVTTILDSLRNAKYLSTIDLRSAFWQIPLDESSKEKTAFGLAGKGLYQFKVMPFGLVNASQTQQRLMDRLFPPEFEGQIFSYLDDIVISNDSFASHMTALTHVKNQLSAAGLTINLDKCQFARSSLKYLGYIVDKEGLRTDPDKVSAIINYPRPNNLTELKRFLGLASWYRRFVENFSIVAAPLHDLTKGKRKGKQINWNKETENAFINLKTALTSTPVLCIPDYAKPFSIQTDASNKGIGAVLVQEIDGQDKPIAYTSRKLSDRECKYSASERELLSVLHAIEQFRPYVEGSHFKVISDHSALQWLHKNKDPHGRLARWAMSLQQFDYEIIHRKGKYNIVPDALSRAIVNEVSVILADVKDEDKDDWYRSIEKTILQDPNNTENWSLDQGRLWKYLKLKQFPDERDDWKLVIPEKSRLVVLQECHDNPSSGHMGVKKTINRVRQKYFWPSLIKDVKDYVRKCETCGKHKSSQHKPTGLMGNHRGVSRPFEIVSLDLMGPFPRSKQGNCMLLVLSCWFSKFCLLFPLRNGKASNITKILEEQVFLLYGAPDIIICDNGKQFTSKEFTELVTNYGIDLWYTPYYHPQANPTERVNKVIGTAVASYIEDNHKEWDKYIPHIGHAMRTSVHEVTGKTPSYLFFGREIAIHGSKPGQVRPKDNKIYFNREKYDTHIAQRNLIYQDVSARLGKAYEVNSRYYNKRRRFCEYRIGDIVWKRTKYLSNADKNFMAKLAPKYEKAIITDKISTDVYKLKNLRGKCLGKWHSSDLKRLY